MKLKIIEPHDEHLMLDLMRSERKAVDTEFYLDRGHSFWGLYNWFSNGSNYCHGLFEGQTLIGMVAVIKLPFELKGANCELHMPTDMLVLPEYRKSFAAVRLFTALHTILPAKDFINIWIENRVGFAQAVPKFSKRLNRATENPRDTNLVTIYPNQKVDTVHEIVKIELTSNWTDIDQHLKAYQADNTSWVKWTSSIDIKEDTFKKVVLFSVSDSSSRLSGLIIDRGNLQSVKWNGQKRLLVEKYRRSLREKNLNLTENDELPFANISFVINSNPEKKISQHVVEKLYQWGYEHNYFGINFRDLNIEIPRQIEHAEFRRRVFLSSSKSDSELRAISEALPKIGVMLESVYL